MKLISACLLTVFICLTAWMSCLAQEKIVTADRLTRDDVENALLSGVITSNCGRRGFPNHGATSLNPDSLLIKGIFQKEGKATIHFMGRFKENIRADGMAVVCEAELQRLDSGEWMDPNNGSILKK